MQFDPARTFKLRSGEVMKVEDKDLTLGWLAIYALDNVNLDKVDGKEMRRRFRIATEIQDAADHGGMADLKSDEIELIDGLVEMAAKRLNNGVLIYGQFGAMLDDLKAPTKPKIVKDA